MDRNLHLLYPTGPLDSEGCVVSKKSLGDKWGARIGYSARGIQVKKWKGETKKDRGKGEGRAATAGRGEKDGGREREKGWMVAD